MAWAGSLTSPVVERKQAKAWARRTSALCVPVNTEMHHGSCDRCCFWLWHSHFAVVQQHAVHLLDGSICSILGLKVHKCVALRAILITHHLDTWKENKMSVLWMHFLLCHAQTQGQHAKTGYCQGSPLGRRYLCFRLAHSFISWPNLTELQQSLTFWSTPPFRDSTPHLVKGVPFASYTGCVWSCHCYSRTGQSNHISPCRTKYSQTLRMCHKVPCYQWICPGS